jgi:hypothetical protein
MSVPGESRFCAVTVAKYLGYFVLSYWLVTDLLGRLAWGIPMWRSPWAVSASHNTMFPQLEDDECGWDAAGTPVRYVKP